MVCKCGYQNEPDDHYCAQCGRRLTGKKSGKGWIIAVVVILALAAGALAMWFVMREEAPVPEESTSEGTPEDDTGVTPPEGEGEEEQEDHWSEDGLYYIKDGEKLKGLHPVDGTYYYFDPETGEKQTGWQEIDGSWHYFTEEGSAPGEGWYSDDDGWFYLEENGRHKTEGPIPSEDGNKEYHLDAEGYLETIKYLKVTCIPDEEEVDGRERQILKPVQPLSGCRELRFSVTEAGGVTPLNGPVEQIWIRTSEGWTQVLENAVPQADDSYLLSFTGTVSFDAIWIFVGQDQTVTPTLTDVVISCK